MGRLFNNTAANYMSRGSVNLGLNGATACSFGYWIKITAVNAAAEQRVLSKEINGLDGWNSIWSAIITNTTTLAFEVQSNTAGDYPDWTINTGIGTGVWTRALFAWERTAGAASTDASVYINGVAVATTHTVNGYTNTFTVQENSSNLYYGIRPLTLTRPLDAALAWVCVWNRKLTAQEALIDYTNPRNVTSGLLSRVPIGGSDVDEVLGGAMTVTGTLRDVTGGEPIQGYQAPFVSSKRPKPFAPGIAR